MTAERKSRKDREEKEEEEQEEEEEEEGVNMREIYQERVQGKNEMVLKEQRP